MRKLTLGSFFNILKKSIQTFRENDPLILGASTAFFATFSIVPIMLIIIDLFSLVIARKTVRHEILEKIRIAFGQETTAEIRTILLNIKALGTNIYITILGALFLLFVATTLLTIVQTSINRIWGIRIKGDKQISRMFKDRLLSVLIIMATGLMLVSGLLVQTALVFIGNYLHRLFPNFNFSLIAQLNDAASFIVVIVWFAFIYKFLPAGKINWKPVWTGSFLTGLLFSLGKFILGKILPDSNIGSIYGASGSIILILLFVFYTAMIFYFGAAFTACYAKDRGYEIKPKGYAVRIKMVELG